MFLEYWFNYIPLILFLTFIPFLILVVLDIKSIVKKKRDSIIIYTTYILIWILLLIIKIIFAIIYDSNYDYHKYIKNQINIDVKSCDILENVDTHGGFLGDGDTIIKIKCPNINYEELSDNWKKLPLSNSLEKVTKMIQCDGQGCKNFYEKYSVPNITDGYYYFLDRNSESVNKFDDTDLNKRASYNFTLAIIDKDTNIIYYYELDT